MRTTFKNLVLATTGFVVVALVVLGGRLLLDRSKRGRAASAAYQLSEAILHQDGEVMRSSLVAPPFIADRSQAERDLFTLELMSGEVSTEGLGILTKEAEFGTLREIFPAQSSTWTQPYGISPDDCVAFKLKRGLLTAELVLHRQSNGGFKVLRANDIRQLAEPATTP